MFVYLAANHFPWDYRWRPDLAPHWNDLGNRTEVDEYLRRQTMSMEDYANFRARLKRDFPGESFLLVRYGDHQPDFASVLIDPTLDDAAIAQQHHASDPKYFTTYYAIDTVNYQAGQRLVRARHHRRTISAAGRAGGRGPAARSFLRRAEAHPGALPRAVLCLRRRRRGAALQSTADRRRLDQGTLAAMPSFLTSLARRLTPADMATRVAGPASLRWRRFIWPRSR